MFSSNRKTALGVAGAIVAALAIPAAVVAAGDKDDSVAPKGKVITLTLKKNTTVTFDTHVENGFPVTVTCTSVTTSFTNSPSQGPINITNPKFKNCSDNVGQSDTITTNSNHGHWKAAFIDAGNDESKKEPAAGDQASLQIPKDGATVTSQLLPSCHVVAAPNGPATVYAQYDDASVAKYRGTRFPISGNGCGTTDKTVTFSATFVYSPGIHDAS